MKYKKLFWGFIFLFDLRIGGFDILPDIIGYISFYQGLSLLEETCSFFSKAKRFALPMIFISIFDIYKVNVFASSSLEIIGVILALIIAIINLLMVYNICLGVSSKSREINNLELESQANSAWKLYLISNILISSSFLLLGLLKVLFIIIFIISIVSYILMLRLMHSASNKLE